MTILDTVPNYGSTACLDTLRASEYGYLDEQAHIYLDYTGAGLAARAQHRAHQARLAGTVFGNPHSGNPASVASTELVSRARARVLEHFKASPDEYMVVFTANASGAARLVGEAYPFRRRARLVLTADNHNSVNGIREFAARRHARVIYVPTRRPDLYVDVAALDKALSRPHGLFAPSCVARLSAADTGHRRSGLFAYPAQSNFSGVRHPLAWVSMAQDRGFDVLLDAAAYIPTSILDLSVVKPEFVTVSWYKLFGYPTGVGCLVMRRDAAARLNRPWFSGGTVQAVTVGTPWHALSLDETAFEDGTVNYLSIPDVVVGLDWLDSIGMPLIQTRVRCLTAYCLGRLSRLRHSDGGPMVEVYGPTDVVEDARGGTIAFNFLDSRGCWVDERLVELESAAAGISLRTGCFCNPGASEGAFGLDVASLSPLLRFVRLRKSRRFVLEDMLRLIGMPTGGAVRISFGLVSTAKDVDRFIAFAEKTYKDRATSGEGLPTRERC
ncbi:PLP-dependent transferase [Thozetella sp. PMI_491]|nr:PLP-dependent transferase [Thozetella sp. PMI_491]